MRQIKKTVLTALVLACLLTVFILVDLAWANPKSLTYQEVIDTLMGKGDWVDDIIVKEINGPRIVTAVTVGAALAVCGAVMQAIFRNPMASPYILGLSSGASLGAAVGILFPIAFIPSMVATPLLAALACFGTMILVYNLSKVGGVVQTETLLLAGIAVSSMLSAFVSFLTFISGDKLEGIVFWSMGNLSRPGWDELSMIVPVVLIGVVMLFYFSKDLNAMMLGDGHAKDLGIDVAKVRFICLILTTVVVAMAVAFVGSIGFVGLVIPHIFRIILGPNNYKLIPFCIFGGATFMLMCDYISRTVAINYGVLPIGVVTAIIGAPYFIYLVRRRKGEVGWG